MYLFGTDVQIKLLFLSFCLLIVACSEGPDKKAPDSSGQTNAWEVLFNGKNLQGWEVLGGEGHFYVADSAIVGETKMGVPTTFLATKKHYDNFILALEFKVHPDLNSGVQIRSNRYKKDTTTTYRSGSLEQRTRDWPAGRVYGYQIEIDPSDRAWTGGLYESGGRGWLQPLQDDINAQQAFRQNEWNAMRVLANDDSLVTYINGIQTATYTDMLQKEGFIGLQLHGVNNEKQAGKKMMFKDIRINKIE